MTLILGAVSDDGTSVHLCGDSKVWWSGEEAKTRRIYTEPALKVILLSEDIAVGFAGSGPCDIAKQIADLDPRNVVHVLDQLARIEGADFLVAHRSPPRLWRVEEGQWGEVSNGGVAMIGDDPELAPGVYLSSRVRSMFDDFPECTTAFRLESTMQHVIFLQQPETIGGFAVVASGTQTAPFRYTAMPVARFNPIHEGALFEEPLSLRVFAGKGATPGALAYWIQNAGLGHLFPHGQPNVRHEIKCDSPAELVRTAQTEYGQTLSAI